MFYGQFVLSKKGPLAKIWLAAHWERKLSKAQIFETNVQDAVDEVMKPKVKLSLRTTGHLLLGIVRIYSRKAKYVLADCNEAFIKIKMAFKNDNADHRSLQEDHDRTDLTEIMHNFDEALPDMNDFDYAPQFHVNQSRIDDITLHEDRLETGSIHYSMVDGDGLDDFEEKQGNMGGLELEEDSVDTARDFGENKISLDSNPLQNHQSLHKSMVDDFGEDMGTADDLDMLFGEDQMAAMTAAPGADMEVDEQPNGEPFQPDSFVLEPLDEVALKPIQKPQAQRQKRKRKLIVDEQKNISGNNMKAHMANYADTIQPLDLAPPTKQLMKLKETGATDKLFTNAGCSTLQDPGIIRVYQSHLVPHARVAPDVLKQVRMEMDMMDNLDENLPPVCEDDGGAPGTPPDYFGDAMEPVAATSHEEPESARKESERRTSQRKPRVHEIAEEEEDEDEQVFTRRTIGVLHSVSTKLKANNDKISFDDLLTKGSTRKTAAQKFYALLELRKSQAIEVEQSESFGPISITSGPQMQALLEANL
jgi:cohesin complex subunit SCC1